MCGIAGFCNPRNDFMQSQNKWISILEAMNRTLKRRGPDDKGTYLSSHCGLSHVRLEIIDLLTGHQPMIKQCASGNYSIVFNGEIYNMKPLREELKKAGTVFITNSDTEVILNGFMLYREDFIKKLNGIFAIAIYHAEEKRLWLFRDRIGIKPLFFTITDNTLVFASEIKGLFIYPGINPVVDKNGLCEIFALGPARTCGNGVFQNIFELLPGEFLTFSIDGLNRQFYWKLESRPHEDSFLETIEKTAWLIEDSVKMQILSDIPICTFLSGGLDSSLVTAICAKELQKQNRRLNTFSFDFKDNAKYFQSNSFQPSQDTPWAKKTSQYLNTAHHLLECDNTAQFECLFRAVDAADLPCMADVESSLLYFCSKVTAYNKVTLTGECADEIFGGYPWFHQEEAFRTSAFPWSSDFAPRKLLLSDDVLTTLPIEEYSASAYEATIAETPRLLSDSPTEKRRREISYLNLRWFMMTLLNRMDRTSMYSGLEARVPLADYRIVEYVFNVPWSMKCPNGIVKGLLRYAGSEFLPEEILWRKKSPYPKTYDPAYETLLADRLKEVLASPNAPIRTLLDTKKVHQFLETPSDYTRPWYGQLMAGPQMLAYLLQVNYWLEHYKIKLV